mmetsp:Transcript_30173/g.46685  ORF Transcript_30173/g.46685 Transcript_30173/m.46685 type:complete len:206 (-) Transcript_30173:15-632(-)
MEDALEAGLVRSIGVSNFTVRHLRTLKRTARVWPPAVNQVEFHPIYPQEELREYCAQEGIVLQAYASLGGQDASKARWKELLGADEGAGSNDKEAGGGGDRPVKKRLKKAARPVQLLTHGDVVSIASSAGRTPAQILLRWALQRNCAVVPKTADRGRCAENMGIFDFQLSEQQMGVLDRLGGKIPEWACGRLCWRNNPLRMLDFD